MFKKMSKIIEWFIKYQKNILLVLYFVCVYFFQGFCSYKDGMYYEYIERKCLVNFYSKMQLKLYCIEWEKTKLELFKNM